MTLLQRLQRLRQTSFSGTSTVDFTMRSLSLIILLFAGVSSALDVRAGEIYRGDLWVIELDDDWQALRRGDQVMFVGPSDSCALQISSRTRAADLSLDDLKSLAGSFVPGSATESPAKNNSMTGLRFTWAADNTYYDYWFLAKAGTFVLASYMCTQGDETEELEAVEAMIASLDAPM